MCTSLFSGCATNPNPVLRYEQFLSSRISEQGNQEFAFALAWRWDSEFVENWREQQLERSGNVRTPRYRAGDLLRPSLNAEQRLRIEDDAVRRLPSALEQRDLCAQGYQIDDVIWERNRVRIMGRCN